MDLNNFTNIIILISSLIIAVKTIKNEIFKSTTENIEEVNKKLDSMNKDIQTLKKVTYALLQHEVTGNHINDMKELFKEINEELFHWKEVINEKDYKRNYSKWIN